MSIKISSDTLFGAFALLFTCLLHAQQNEQPELFELSFDELLEMSVSVATGDEERIGLTPAVVSSLNYEQMQSMGLRKVEDVLSFLPGVQVQKTAIGTTTVGIRGLVEPFNQKVLFMLDGVPYWQPSHGDNALLGIPASAIERIEVIRGPGAVIYGTNASAGVINIVTRKRQEKTLQLHAGSENEQGVQAYGRFQLKEGLHLELSGQWLDRDGFTASYTNRPQPPFFPSVPPPNAEFERGFEKRSAMLQLHWQDLDLTLQSFETLTQGLAGPAASTNLSELRYRGDLLALNYSLDTAWGELEWYTDYNRFYLEIANDNLFAGREFGTQTFNEGDNNFRWRLGGQWRGRYSDNMNLLLGAEWEHRQTGPYEQQDRQGQVRVTAMPAASVHESSLFGQLDYHRGNWRWLLGTRLVDNQSAGSKWLPRLSVVNRLSQHSSLKFLYATGYNAPNLFQQYINIPPGVVLGSEDLVAEKVDSLELAYSYQTDTQLLVINAYYLKAEDFIQRVSNAAGTSAQYRNAENFSRHGVEVDWQRSWPSFTLLANAAYQPDAGDRKEDDLSAYFFADLTASLGVNYYLDANSQLGASWRYIAQHAAASQAYLLNVSYQYQWDGHSLTLSAENLLGETLQYADVQDFIDNRVIPGNDGSRLWFLRYGYRF
ncbi:TonB-dependent receptor plug domain-containing protein [Bowmanella dokdonensis]|uniref:TonB-dependent receptor n=1 Tax=Bowmanella dokdonensis TaxID=751969 RepID=A0A939IN80_9ALTE|nr:TonB-dependent receptor [Bowmanella dokdonensis]MBN7826078.1 TonB-dependent receptor [Bowmanella dokdonensis]